MYRQTEETTKEPNAAEMYRQTKSQNNVEVQTDLLIPENPKIQIVEQQPEVPSVVKSTLPEKKSQWWIIEFIISSLSIVLNFIFDFFYGFFQRINQIFKQ